MAAPHRSTLLGLSCVLVALSSGSAALEPEDGPKLAGTWIWSWNDPKGETHRHVLEIEGTGAKLAARERFDELAPVRVTGLMLDGKNLKLTVVRDQKRADYSGVVADSDTINGTVSITFEGQTTEYVWKAKRVPKS